VVIGIGEMGGVFARALLRNGHPVIPVLRTTDAGTVAEQFPDPELVLVTVAEADLDAVLHNLPSTWRDRVGLVQNELLPPAWQAHGITDPTVASVWFEKKAGRPVKVIIPTPVAGPAANTLVAALGAIDIAAEVVDSGQPMLDELIAKNLYILTANIAGLRTGGTVGQLWTQNHEFAAAIADEVLDIQEALVGHTIDRPAAIAGMVRAFEGDPDHGTTGRSAPARLARAIAQADEFTIEAPTMRVLQADLDANLHADPPTT
jgi:ketopantoate reductase